MEHGVSSKGGVSGRGKGHARVYHPPSHKCHRQESQHKAVAQLEQIQSASPKQDSRLRFLSGSWLQNVIYYRITGLRCRDGRGFFKWIFPGGLSTEAQKVSRGRRERSSDRTPMYEPAEGGAVVWGPEVALTASGKLALRSAGCSPQGHQFIACLQHIPDAQS